MSTDQRLLYEYTKRNRFRKSGQRVLFLENWSAVSLSIACSCYYTCCCLYTEESPSGNLIKLVYDIVKLYAPLWFEIKFSSKLHESRRILFWNLSRIDRLSFDDVKTIAKQNFQENFFCLLPENFLYALIKDEDPIVRNLGLLTIIHLRSKNR